MSAQFADTWCPISASRPLTSCHSSSRPMMALAAAATCCDVALGKRLRRTATSFSRSIMSLRAPGQMHRHAGLLALEFTEITTRVRSVAHPGKKAGLDEIVQQLLTVSGLDRPQTSGLPHGQSEARHFE